MSATRSESPYGRVAETRGGRACCPKRAALPDKHYEIVRNRRAGDSTPYLFGLRLIWATRPYIVCYKRRSSPLPSAKLLGGDEQHRANEECLADKIQSEARPYGVIVAGLKAYMAKNP